MSSSTIKNRSPSEKSIRTRSTTSDDDVFSPGPKLKYRFPSVDAIRDLQQKRGSVVELSNSRRLSVAFPVTKYVSKWRNSLTSKSSGSLGERVLKNQKSQEDLVSRLQRSGDQSWRVWQLILAAKKKFNGEVELPRTGRRMSFTELLKVATLGRSETHQRKMVRLLKHKVQLNRQKHLLAKFRMAVKLTIFCARNFREHCLRINAEEDELAPFIRQLHFHEDDTPDLLIDLTQFKANRQLRIPEETKRILSKEVGERTEQEIYSVTIALRNIKCIGDYPKRMQKKIAEVGLYEKYEAKRIIVRQGHPATGFYFILSGTVVVMVMDTENKFARAVAHLYKGQTFGELAIVNKTNRNSTVICKETCEFLSISVQDYHKIFMDGGIRTVDDPDQEIFLKSLSYLVDWPTHILKDHPTKCKFLFFKRNEVITANSHQLDWVIIVKSGSIQVLKKLKKVEAFEWRKKNNKAEFMTAEDKRELAFERSEWRRILPELSIPLRNMDVEDEEIIVLRNGKPEPFVHPDGIPSYVQPQRKKQQIPNLWPFRVDLSEVEYGKYIEDESLPFKSLPSIQEPVVNETEAKEKRRPGLSKIYRVSNKIRRPSVMAEEEKELLGFQPHIRTIMEDIEIGVQEDQEGDPQMEDNNPEFVHVQTLTKGQAFGLADVLIGDQPSLSVISKGADCLLINKQFYLEHATEKLLRDVRQNVCPFPTDEELQKGLQLSVDWKAYRKSTLNHSLENLSLRRLMRHGVRGTKVQEAFT